jgi:hypothetical protein
MAEPPAIPEGQSEADVIDPESEALLRAAIDGLVAEMREIRRLREENAALRERHRAIERDIEDAEDALRKSEREKPVPLWLAVTRGTLRPDLQQGRLGWLDFVQLMTKCVCLLSLYLLLVAIR